MNRVNNIMKKVNLKNKFSIYLLDYRLPLHLYLHSCRAVKSVY